jgi:hypothetical protein
VALSLCRASDVPEILGMRKRVTDPLRAAEVNAAMEANERGLMPEPTIYEVIATGAGAVSVPHTFGEKPTDFLYSSLNGLLLYASAAQRVTWSESNCDLTATGADTFRVWFVRGVVA